MESVTLNLNDAENLLRLKSPEQIFEKETVKERYRALVKIWHPDVSQSSNKLVFPHITSLYNRALEKVQGDYWGYSGILKFSDFLFRFYVSYPFELGTLYVGSTHIVYCIDKKYKSYVDNMGSSLKTHKYASPEMEKEFSKYFPSVKKITLHSDNYYIIIPKQINDVPLQAVFKYATAHKDTDLWKLWDRHIAWIISRMLNILCFLEYNQITHNDISMSTVFITPEFHAAQLYGGWYATEIGKKLTGVPTRTYELYAYKGGIDKKANPITDVALLKLLARELLKEKDYPKAFKNWVQSPDKLPMKEFKIWQKVLDDSYGVRKFIPMEITMDELYTYS